MAGTRDRSPIPVDLLLGLSFTVVLDLLVLYAPPSFAPIRIVFGVLFVVFVPGYVVSTALFPEVGWDSLDITDSETIDHVTLDSMQRVTLSVGFSVAVVLLTGLALNYTPWGIRLVPVLVALNAVVVVFLAVSVYRRPYTKGLSVLADGVSLHPFPSVSRRDALMNVLLLVSVLALIGSVGVVFSVPNPSEGSTEFYLTTLDDDGDLTAMSFAEELTVGEPTELVVGVHNDEHRRVDYTVVVQLQEVTVSDDTTTVRRSRELRQFSPTLTHNQTWQQPHELRPPISGEGLRLQYLLFRGTAPDDASAENAYRRAHLWVTVENATDA